MRNARLIQDCRDKQNRATRRTLADGLARLDQELEAKPQSGRWHICVPQLPAHDAIVAAIWFEADEGEDIVIPYPFSKGCWAITEIGNEIYLPLVELDGAVPQSCDGRVLLKDGRVLRALEFDIIPHPRDFTDLEHAIVFLTVRFLEAESIGFRYIPEAGWWNIDYCRLHELRVRNVKELARYIDSHIGTLSRPAGKPPFSSVSLDKIQDTLRFARIQKARGRKARTAG